ncbi:MAG: hypothetical protein AAFN44_07680 [Pseudomonadota bacterium]
MEKTTIQTGVLVTGADSVYQGRMRAPMTRLLPFPDDRLRAIPLTYWHWQTCAEILQREGWELLTFTRAVYELAEEYAQPGTPAFEAEIIDNFARLVTAGARCHHPHQPVNQS